MKYMYTYEYMLSYTYHLCSAVLAILAICGLKFFFSQVRDAVTVKV